MFLIIQTGDPVELAKPYGGFADYFINGMQLDPGEVQVVNVHQGEALPNCSATFFNGVVITGSASMVTDCEDWVVTTQHWLEQAFKHQIPVLGVCFGHQLLAGMLGGQVGFNPKGRHMGISVCRLNHAGKQDELLGQLTAADYFDTFVSHQQAVITAPESVKVLASCEYDINHAFRYQTNVWGVQFHPEWTQPIMTAYIKQRQAELIKEGFDTEAMMAQLKPCKTAWQLLVDFRKIAEKDPICLGL